MIWKSDYTGRFPERPYWDIDELERRCEEKITPFLEAHYGQPPARLSTEALTLLIEHEAERLDLDRELIADNPDEEIHGVTWFHPGDRPEVQINRRLRREFRRVNRYRTTLAHEYGHLILHVWLYDRFCHIVRPKEPLRCYSKSVMVSIDLVRDWMEWQAGYMCGALLMPRWRVALLVAAFAKQRCVNPPVKDGSIASTCSFQKQVR